MRQLCHGHSQERPAISLLDTCSQSDLVDKEFLEAAGSDMTCRPAPGTVVLEGVAGGEPVERERVQLTFCVSEGGPRYEVTFAVVETYIKQMSLFKSQTYTDVPSQVGEGSRW